MFCVKVTCHLTRQFLLSGMVKYIGPRLLEESSIRRAWNFFFYMKLVFKQRMYTLSLNWLERLPIFHKAYIPTNLFHSTVLSDRQDHTICATSSSLKLPPRWHWRALFVCKRKCPFFQLAALKVQKTMQWKYWVSKMRWRTVSIYLPLQARLYCNSILYLSLLCQYVCSSSNAMSLTLEDLQRRDSNNGMWLDADLQMCLESTIFLRGHRVMPLGFCRKPSSIP